MQHVVVGRRTGRSRRPARALVVRPASVLGSIARPYPPSPARSAPVGGWIKTTTTSTALVESRTSACWVSTFAPTTRLRLLQPPDLVLTIEYEGVTNLASTLDRFGATVKLDEVLPHDDGCSHEIAFHGGRLTLRVAADLTARWSEFVPE